MYFWEIKVRVDEVLINGVRSQERAIQSNLGFFKRKKSLINPFYSQLSDYYSVHCCRSTDPICLRNAGPAFSSWAHAVKMDFSTEHSIIFNAWNEYALWSANHSVLSLDAVCCFLAYSYAGSISAQAGPSEVRQMRAGLREVFNSLVLDNLAHFMFEHTPSAGINGGMVNNISDYQSMEKILATASVLVGESLC